MSTEKKLPRLTDCSLLTIQIVGTLPPIRRDTERDYHQQMDAFLSTVKAQLLIHFPDFIPAHPPIRIAISDLAEPGE